MTDSANILIVDDEEFNRVMMEGLLEETYQTNCVNDGEACLLSVQENMPDLVILDVDMPGIDGLETCRRLRAQYNDLELPILFVSGMTSDDDRLEGYKAGGNDYITKPYNEDELLSKIKVIFDIDKLRKETQLSSLESQKVTQEALKNVFEVGNILAFVKNSFHCLNYKKLSEELFNSLELFNLQGSVLFIAQDGGRKYFFHDDFQRPMEITALNKVHETDKRHIDFGTKTIFNAPSVSILIRNMPQDDEDLKGRLKDNFSTLVDALNSRVTSINAEILQREKHQMLEKMIAATRKNLREIESEQNQQQLSVSSIISDIGSQIEDLFLHLALEETQEKAIIEVISEAEKRSDDLFSQNVNLETRFELIIQALEHTK